MLQSVGNKMKRNIIILSGIFMFAFCFAWAVPRQIGPQVEEYYTKNNFKGNEESFEDKPSLIRNNTDGVVSII